MSKRVDPVERIYGIQMPAPPDPLADHVPLWTQLTEHHRTSAGITRTVSHRLRNTTIGNVSAGTVSRPRSPVRRP